MNREELKKEALKRMKYLGLSERCIEAFKEDKVWMSELYGSLYETDSNLQNAIRQYEEKTGDIVYHVIRGVYTVGFPTGECEDMMMDSFLYVSQYDEDWPLEHKDLLSGIVYAYVHNHTYPELSECGSISVAPQNGGLVRTSNYFDYKEFHKKNGDQQCL